MWESLAQSSVAIVGGDRRQIMVAERMLDWVAWVKTYGLTAIPDLPRMFPAKDLKQALTGSRVIILPISGVDGKGMVKTMDPAVRIKIDQQFLELLEEKALIVTGSIPLYLKQQATQLGVRVFEYAERDEIAIPNAIPTAEGAIQLMMENTAFTVNGSCCLLLGFGRVAQALAARLLAWGAVVLIAARSPEQLAKADSWGCTSLFLSRVAEEVSKADLVFNTIPAKMVTEEIVSRMKPGTLIIDLASAPGGVDFQAAEKYKITAILALGLPGKVAPLTAGNILATKLPGLIEQELNCGV
ncbi:MAG TPA: dipicolinate synthase subunit DpsA [Firmicutes bacterium]|jgi:dipicolinate synthase subunit A|nr:dipicolinate synthase subunit DpsA [Bacillota bacterium]HBT18255.1 dipicolinate synthase subunit DpsA [Bacillota bacterium]